MFTNEKPLTAAELGKLWVSYMGNSMGKCILGHYLQHVEDKNIERVVRNAYNLSDKLMNKITDIFKKENIPHPVGFTNADVDLAAPRLFSDQYYLHYLRYTCKAGLSIYSIAIPLMSRKDIRQFFIHTSEATANLISDINNVILSRGNLMDPAPIPPPQKVDFVKKQSYLKGFMGETRPLHALEITHLYDNIDNNITSKALLIAFSQTAVDKRIKNYFIRGKKITDKHIEVNTQKLNDDNLPAPSLLDHLVTTSITPPYSDKLMLAHKIDMFSMKVRSYGNAISLNGRRDLGAMYGKFLGDLGAYVEDGANIMIDHGWMEQPPQAVDRDSLTTN
ncbi:DUF3231 family protein [Thalassobacillus pellis]|uniref:DUF3231 family protein n=1 Tax=Thalassobacillus pellis TaxID=748008 RepID=UPI001961754B|nr:DUF3231 family protein [Thalassobacillus pellis]MBM7552093.1 hypothetical protein [Thalassobacillus pellis]